MNEDLRKKRYVVGFSGEGQVVYGKDYKGESQWAEPLTIFQAGKIVKKLHPDKKVKRVIYELVPVMELKD